jgi:LysR family transcriptional regulator, glycine cleavage system transcriptional activator
VSKSHKSTSRRTLPPLNATRAFEACARLGSTVAAAAELGVTHGAVSKQLAVLEGWLEVLLFHRDGVRLTVTQAGARYAATLGRALDLIDTATKELGQAARETPPVVRVSTTASFAALWLLPRLAGFRARHPEVEVWVSETKAAVHLGADGEADLALRMGAGPWPGVRCEPLMSDSLIVVCAPSVAARLTSPSDLAKRTLLHDEDPQARWPEWLASVGLGQPSWGSRGPRIADGALLLQAAAQGQGVALTRARLAAEWIADGRLVRPLPYSVQLPEAYWLVLPARGSRPPAVRAFVGWVREESSNEDEA